MTTISYNPPRMLPAGNTRGLIQEGATVTASRSHGTSEELDRLLQGRKIAGRTSAGSALKFCLVAAATPGLPLRTRLTVASLTPA